MTENDRFTVGLVQMNCRLGDQESNLARAKELLSELAGRARIACLPEMFSTGYNRNALGDRTFELAESVPGPTTDKLGVFAGDIGMAIVAGIVERDPENAERIYDTVVLLDPQGKLIGRYRKSHLYPAENSFFRAGDELSVFDVDGLNIGVAICFEHAFPQVFATLALRGAQVVFNPSAVPVGFCYLQDLRTRARAQDNQIFVVAANHVGSEGDIKYCGRSQVADPRGEVLVMGPEDRDAALLAELSLDLILDQRQQEPVFRGLRPELYEPRKR